MTRIIIFVILCLSITACSNQQVYGTLQAVEHGRCVDGPANDYRDCMERNSMEYSEYAAMRDANEENR